MINVRIVYCVPCGHLPRALELANNLLQSFGTQYNKKFSVTLDTSDGGTFDVYINDKKVYSRKEQGGRFPTADEIVKAVREIAQ
ncbi:MAG: Rdx family protein [Nitrososphaerota archaeon]